MNGAHIKKSDRKNKIPEVVVDEKLKVEKFEVEIMNFEVKLNLKVTILIDSIRLYLIVVAPSQNSNITTMKIFHFFVVNDQCLLIDVMKRQSILIVCLFY